jgi:hypothetical protein
MNLTIEIPDDKTAALLAKATTLGVSAEQYVERMVNEDLEEPTGSATENNPRRHIAEVIREIWRDLPDEARAKLPTDGAAQVDHYVYGLPKRDQ